MADNPEQERALRIVADHFISGTDNQLLMYSFSNVAVIRNAYWYKAHQLDALQY
ncbi:hypothetical protein B0H14DRAFT_3423897 [Mycena olivaceomarginata]|nr:hypothetical protein B0H14DRAFT_3497742 [Mycena olivaceomarginata]KAJ7899583.1 hypothetical protein B0H14DRAFT_3423897 [Mycena olivaceomarginata]